MKDDIPISSRLAPTLSIALTAVLLAAAAAPASGQEDGGGSGPRVALPAPVADLGTVDRGEKVSHDFVIRNEGDEPLEIIEVRPACGCTVAENDEVIPPGGSGVVHAELDTASIDKGSAAKGISVLTNDPDNPRLQLTLMVKVTDYLSFNPSFARFVQGKGHEPGTVHSIFYSANYPGLEIEGVEEPFPFLDVDVREATEEERREDADGNQWVLTLTLDYDRAPVGPLAGTLEVHTNHPRQPVGRLPVSGFVRPLLAVTPPVIEFGEIDLSEGMLARFLVRNFGTDPVRVTRVEPSIPGAEGRFEAIEEGRRYRVEVTLGDEVPKGPLSTELKIFTDSPDEPVLVVPISGTIL